MVGARVVEAVEEVQQARGTQVNLEGTGEAVINSPDSLAVLAADSACASKIKPTSGVGMMTQTIVVTCP